MEALSISQTKSRLRLALDDIREGVLSNNIWGMLGWLEVKQRYRRSVLGPFWLTISSGMIIAAMGPLYGRLFGQPIGDYFAYLAVSYVIWQLISQVITDACYAFINAESFIKQVRLPLTVHILRILWRSLIIFLHNFIIVLLVLAYFRPAFGWHLLLFPVALLMFVVNAVWVSLILALVCARFRDIPLIVNNLVLVAFFVTPIMWSPQMLGRYQWTVNLNPFYHFLEIIRQPLLGGELNLVSWAAVPGITVVGFAAMLKLFSRFRARVAYWV
ncbi:MAG TPA: ABC transporter permease [Burkholderiales bacterium]|nr:ABC transporter permease [Burkholderiales bacterium]